MGIYLKESRMLNLLAQEWKILQKSYDQYESYSLMIKLLTITLTFISLSLGFDLLLIATFITILWLQDAIWKTFQARIEVRLIKLENFIADNNQQTQEINLCLPVPFQFNDDFASSRQGVLGLIKEYLTTMLKPTVAYPYGFLLFLLIFLIE